MDREIDEKHDQLWSELQAVRKVAEQTLEEARRTNGKVRKIIIAGAFIGGIALAAALGVEDAISFVF